MASEAEEMRRVDMTSETYAVDASAILRRVMDEAGGRWASLLQEVCFWAEAVVWAAWDGDVDAFNERRAMMDGALTDGLASMRTH